MVKADYLVTTNVSNDLCVSCIILKEVSSLMVNLLLIDDMCRLLYMHLQNAFCFCSVLTFCVSVSKTFMGSIFVDS